MKVVFMEEIEAKKAWTNKMCCPRCDEMKYKIHHQFQPWPDVWWVECENCGYETSESLTREAAIERWKNR